VVVELGCCFWRGEKLKSEEFVVMGYVSGEVYFFDAEDGDGFIFLQSCLSLSVYGNDLIQNAPSSLPPYPDP
jgi:hypothetical protein